MFNLIHDHDVATSFINEFDAALSAGAMVSNGWLSTPGGGFEAQIYYRKDLNIWAYVDKELYVNRYSLWFGAGEPTWRPAIEINVPVRRTLHCYGQLAKDSDGTTHLLHKGGLGGGKYTVKADVFADLIDGFVRDDVVDGSRGRKYFVIGSASDPGTLIRLAAYVREATRIRKLRENEEKYSVAIANSGGSYRDGNALGGEYKNEFDKDGEYYVHRIVAFQRTHAKVQKALAEELKSRNVQPYNSRLSGGIGPDIYTKRNDGTMDAVFEIKVGSDSQSIFTAIGQLIVYSSGGDHSTKRFLVVNDMPKSNLFMSAVKKLDIIVIKYKMNEGHVSFDGL